jgi:hypothetical protein
MRMTEADYEYLIHTLSEARSRATEIAVGVRARAGADHNLAKIGDDAVAKIESLLNIMRLQAAERPEPGPRLARDAERKPALRTIDKAAPPAAAGQFALPSNIGPEHWLNEFLRDVFRELGTRGNVSIENVDRMWKYRRDAFVRDRETARRMVRTYPELFGELPRHTAARAAARGVGWIG